MKARTHHRRIRLMMFCNTIVRGGAEEHILTLLRGLDRARFETYFVCPPALVDLMRSDLPADVELLPIQLRSFRDVRGALQLQRVLREREIDLIHSHMFYSSLFASPIAKASGVPAVIETGHGREHWRRGWKKRYWIDRWVGRCVDQYIAVSEATARYMVDDKRLPSGKIAVIQNGCDLQRFQHVVAPAGLREQIGARPGEPILVVPGRLETQKGHRYLLEAMPQILQTFPDAKLVCVGDGVLRSELEAQTRQLQLEKSVRFVGYQSNIEEWMALADAIVMPSLYEGLPLVAIEALASARALVATAVDGTTEVVVNGKTGISVPSESPAALATAIVELLADPEKRSVLARDGREWVEQSFSRDRQIQRTQDLYVATMMRCAGWAPTAGGTHDSSTSAWHDERPLAEVSRR